MKLGMPTLFELNTIEEHVYFAKKHNLDFIELNCNFPFILEDILYNKKKLKRVLGEIETTIHFFDDGDFASDDFLVKSYFSIFKKICKNASYFNTKLINIHLNLGRIVTINGKKNYINEKYENTFNKKLLENILKLDEYAKKYGITLTVENLVGPEFIKNAFYLLEENNIHLTYDIGHDYIDSNRLSDFYFNSKKIKEFHFHDASDKPHLELGKGNMPLAKYYKLIKDDSYVVIEVKSIKELESSIRVFRDYE